MISGGMLTFSSSPDYENPTDMGMDNTYMVTIMADDGTYMAMRNVTVTVTNEDEDGAVTLNLGQPVAGTAITASLTDPDSPDGITDVTWQWASSATADGTFATITGATNAAYTPVEADVGMYLRATASYTDGHGSGKMKMAVSDNMVIMASTNNAPAFPDTEDGTREVAENTAADAPVGSPVTANDADGDTLTYTLGGTDAALFAIDGATGQITVGAGTVLDYETRTTYMVTVTATDAADDDTITVTITVTDKSLGTLGDTYDADHNEEISKSEALAAVRAYFRRQITKDDAIGIIALYFASRS